MIAYLDTSAAMKLVVDEAESEVLAEHLEAGRELRCAVNRHPQEVIPDAVSEVLSTVALVDVERGDLTTAPLLPGRLRSADAIHLATALRVGAEQMVVYDEQLRSAAKAAGIRPLSPA